MNHLRSAWAQRIASVTEAPPGFDWEGAESRFKAADKIPHDKSSWLTPSGKILPMRGLHNTIEKGNPLAVHHALQSGGIRVGTRSPEDNFVSEIYIEHTHPLTDEHKRQILEYYKTHRPQSFVIHRRRDDDDPEGRGHTNLLSRPTINEIHRAFRGERVIQKQFAKNAAYQYDSNYDPDNLGPPDAAKHRILKVPIEHVRQGDIVRPSWGNFPFERAAGDAVHDPTHPGDDSENEADNKAEGWDTTKMYTVPYRRRFSPHYPNGTTYHVRIDRHPTQAAADHHWLPDSIRGYPLPHGGQFAISKNTLDPDIFDPHSETMRPWVRLALMALLDSFWGPRYGSDWQSWTRIYLAGSLASYWWGTSDMDILVGVDSRTFVKGHSEFRGFSDAEVCQALTHDFYVGLDITVQGFRFPPAPDLHRLAPGPLTDQAYASVAPETPVLAPEDFTWYANADAYDIRRIRPYAAYEAISNRWAVHPARMDKHWGPKSLSLEFWNHAADLADQIKSVLAMAEGEQRVNAALGIYDQLHLDRGLAFGPMGTGVGDRRSLLWVALNRWGLLGPLEVAAHPGRPMAHIPPALARLDRYQGFLLMSGRVPTSAPESLFEDQLVDVPGASVHVTPTRFGHYLSNTLVDYRRRGEGVGSALYDKLTRRADERGQDLITHVFPTNEGSMALHRKFGFEPEEDPTGFGQGAHFLRRRPR